MMRYQWLALTLCLFISACTTGTATLDAPEAPPKEPAPKPIEATETEAAAVPSRPFPANSLYDLLVAEFAVRRNRFDLALGHYLQQAHETRDTGVTARATRLAQFLRADKASLDAAQLWIELEPDNLEAQYTTSTLLAKKKQPLKAMEHMIIVLNKGGRANFPAIAASALTLDKETLDTLEGQFDKLLLEHPNNSQLHTSKALLLRNRSALEPALLSIKQAIEIDPENLHAIVVEARLLQQLNRHDKALIRLEQAVEQNPQNRRLRLQFARLLMTQDINKAKAQFEYLLAETPNDADLLLSLALISKEVNQPEQAKSYFERLLASGKHSEEAHYYLAQLAELKRDWATAIQHYLEIPTGKDFLAATTRIAELYMQQKSPSKARQILQERRQQHPQFAIRFYLLEAEILFKGNKLKKSYQLLSEALLTYPKQLNLLYIRSMVSEKLNKLDWVESDLRTIIEQDSHNAIALNALGYVLANHNKRLDEAYQLISKALKLKPGDPAILDSLGWVEFRRGNHTIALSLLEKAYASYPDPEVAAHLGEVLWITQQKDRAQQIWEKALKEDPTNPPLIETLQRLAPQFIKAPRNTP